MDIHVGWGTIFTGNEVKQWKLVKFGHKVAKILIFGRVQGNGGEGGGCNISNNNNHLLLQ